MKICVIGGGASGMMAAFAAAKFGGDVTLLEHNEKLGKKMYITGKGRCNVTNNCSAQEFLQNVVSNPKFLHSAINAFSPHDTQELLESCSLKLKIERGRRVFPESDKSSDVISALARAVRDAGAKVELNCGVTAFRTDSGRISAVQAGGVWREFDAFIIATGGASYPLTGSTGDGYRFARTLGHTVTPLKPSLVGFITQERFDLAGLTLKNVTAKLVTASGSFSDDIGELLFTHEGVSGPIALTISAKAARAELSGSKLIIDLKPALDAETLDKRLLRDFAEDSNKLLKHTLTELLPEKLIFAIIAKSGVPGDKRVHQVTAAERKQLLRNIKALEFTVIGTEPLERAVVTSGGIPASEVFPASMKSRIIENLYFAGEILDVDALTGGYNLQIAFSTGFLAGRAAATGK